MKVMQAGMAGLLAGLALTSCAKNPATGANQLMLISESQEIQMGLQYDSQVVSTIGLYPDQALQQYVQQLGAKLAANSERPNLPWTFRVVNDPAVNAFAIPGGHVYVTRGILPYLNSEAQLAGVMGHEIGHVTARHTAAAMSKEQLANLGLAIGSVASPALAQYAGAANQALGLLFLKFSRDNESQADELGLRYMGRASYDVHEMPAIFTMLDRQSKLGNQGGALPEWLETHPTPEHRLEAINKDIAALPGIQSQGTVNTDGYLQHMNGLVFGVDPREGFFSNGRFYHPTLRFQLEFPKGWATNNGAQAVTAVSPNQDAAIELTMAKERSGDAAARAFLSQQGITAASLQQGSINGMSATSAPFTAATNNGTVTGLAMFMEYNGQVYQILGYAPDVRWSGYQSTIENTIHSFAPLTDSRILNMQAQRVEVTSVAQGMTLADLTRARQTPVSVDLLAVMNQVEVQTPLPPGKTVKWVTGAPQQLP